jgi:mRNA interferase RelE/StbE
MPLKKLDGMPKPYQVVFDKKYVKDLKYIHPSYHQAIKQAALSLAINPRPEGSIKLKGFPHLFRIKIGPYRMIYTIQDHKLIVLVLEIGDRKDIYKNY